MTANSPRKEEEEEERKEDRIKNLVDCNSDTAWKRMKRRRKRRETKA